MPVPDPKDCSGRGPFSTHHFIKGDFMIIRPTHLRFNEEMSLKEDYDYTIQHIIEYSGVLRNHRLLTQFQHEKNPGGAVDRRTVALEQENISRLQLAYPGWFRKSRRLNQITIYTPKIHQKIPYSKPIKRQQKPKSEIGVDTELLEGLEIDDRPG